MMEKLFSIVLITGKVATVFTADTKKYLVVIGAVVLLLAIGAFMFLGSNTNNKTDLAGSGGASPIGENDGILPDADSNSETSGSDTTAGECPPGTVLNEEIGECEQEDKVPDEVGPIGEQPATVDYTKLLYRYAETDVHCKQILWGDVDGNLLYSRVLLYEPNKNLIVSVGYLDDEKNWNEEKRFITTDAYKSKTGAEEETDYHGYFIKTDDPSYKSGGVTLGIYTNPIRLNPKGYVYAGADGQQYRLCYDPNVDPPVIYTGK
jgi:hypothetical protein